jgi:isopentenyl-diphosphate delta-isomerase
VVAQAGRLAYGQGVSGDEPGAISQRKADHLSLAASGEAEFKATRTLLDEVKLVHQSLPELRLDDIDLGAQVAGVRLKAPLIISGMTGGTAAAAELNRDLARAAEALGLGFGLGSQRAMAVHPELAPTFEVRAAAPGVALFANVGAVQARELGVAAVRGLVERVGADALCVHLNPAQEMIQEEGDRDFTGCVATIGQLVAELGVPVIAKETGCGLSRQAARALAGVGVRAVDVSGAGGTSWTAVEARRARPGSAARALGELLWDWGIPTAVTTVVCAEEGLEVVATGGMRSGLDVARALALGAAAGGMAAPVLRAHREGGYDGVLELLGRVIDGIRVVCLLTAARSARQLRLVPRVIGRELRDWLEAV